MTLYQWVLAYQLNQGSMTEAQWAGEFAKFCADLRQFRRESNQ